MFMSLFGLPGHYSRGLARAKIRRGNKLRLRSQTKTFRAWGTLVGPSWHPATAESANCSSDCLHWWHLCGGWLAPPLPGSCYCRIAESQTQGQAGTSAPGQGLCNLIASVTAVRACNWHKPRSAACHKSFLGVSLPTTEKDLSMLKSLPHCVCLWSRGESPCRGER